MSTYEAIIKAAEHIEGNPEAFRFSNTQIPCTSRGEGCALGWIGYFLGRKYRGDHFWQAAMALRPAPGPVHGSDVGMQVHYFYDRMSGFCLNWKRSASECASALRSYAEAYHGHEKVDPAYLKFRDELKTEKAEKADAEETVS